MRVRHAQIKGIRDRFTKGLKGIEAVQKFTEAKQDELSKKSPLLVAQQQELEVLVDKLKELQNEITKRIEITKDTEKEI